jgi:carbon storage regulator CsrA
VGRSIQIGPDVTVTVLEIEAGKIRLGITTPREKLILRSELTAYSAQAREYAKKAATEATP